MQKEIQVLPLSQSRGDIHRFLGVSHRVYREDPLWVAPLRSDMVKVLGPTNPLFQHADIRLWIARHNGRDVGRIAGIIDHHYEPGSNTAFFGFFESMPDREISDQLFAELHRWTTSKGCQRLLGPMNPSTNDECGLLIDGFHYPPAFMMPYNPDYYPNLITAQGYAKAIDLVAFHIDLKSTPIERLHRLADRFRKRNPDLLVRPATRKNLDADLPRIVELYNEAWEQNWGFVQMTADEIRFLADRLKPLLVEGLVQATESNGKVVGFLVAVPDVNEILKPLKGSLCSPGLLKALPYLVGWKNPKRARVIVLGVKQEFRGRGIESVMLAAGLKTGADIGLEAAEAGWVLENNLKSRRVIETVGGKIYKRNRIYEKRTG